MYQIHQLNKISPKGTDLFTEKYTLTNELQDSDAVLVRSANMHEMEMPESLLAIARAGAGVNNIPLNTCSEQGIVVFNTPGANANSVMELALCGMLLGSRDIVDGINWVQSVKDDPNIAKTVESGKSRFAGSEIRGKNLGIIGLGAIGGPLANAAVALGMDVLGCDPYMSVDAAWKLSRSVHKADTREEIFAKADFISLHTPLIDNADPKVGTKYMINKETIAMMKDGVVILNFARDALVNDDDLEEALKSGKVRKYVTDFPNARTAGMEGVIAIPHLGASTEESEDNCAVMAAEELVAFLESGNIKNSVNYPSVEMPHHDGIRLVILHRNIPNMLSHISTTLAENNINIENLTNRSKGDYAVTLVDVLSEVTESTTATIQAMEGIIRVLKID